MTAPRRTTAPLRAYVPPAYPARDAADPRLLARHVPRRWRRNPVLLVLLAGTLPAAPGCGNPALGVAPVADHGDGIGSFGCVAVVPPVFLSEADAAAIVRDELAAAGLADLSETVRLDDVPLGSVPWYPCRGEYGDVAGDEPLVADFLDQGRAFAVEVLTESDHGVMVHKSGFCDSSVDSVDLRGLAEVVSDRLAAEGGERWYGVLYDPVADVDYEAYDDCWEDDDPSACEDAALAEAKEASAALLREQVADLVAWMREQGLL